MFSHVHIGITDFERALAFYSGVMDELGFTLKFAEPEKPWAGWMQAGRDRPLFLYWPSVQR
jgi:catechol 2,3-dioxygenase-like lactoylglutathione lyase family enzyme